MRTDRRTFLKTTGALTAGATLYPYLGCVPRDGAMGEAAAAAEAGWSVRPFSLSQVTLGDGLFREKRERMLHYARNYGSPTDPFAGPDRLLSIFRANAGLDTKGAEPVGSWENATGYLRGHYAGHFMSMLAQAYAGTGEEIYKEKLDYMVGALAECQGALAEAARLPTPRVPGRIGGALRLTGSPIGLAEHVRLPEGIVSGLNDFSVAFWISLSLYDPDELPDLRREPVELLNQSVVFDFGRPNSEYAEPALAHMYLTVRASNENPVPRFAITTTGEEGEEALEGAEPLPLEEWVHLAVTREGRVGTLFVNGRAVATNPAMTLGPADLGSTPNNWLGRRQFPQRTVSYLNGSLDEFQIFSRALSAVEVGELVEAPGLAIPGSGADGGAAVQGVSDGSMVAWYPFDEVDGPVAVDASGNGRDATIVAPTDGRRHSGFLSAYPETQFMRLEEFATYGSNQGIWAPYYTLHKIMAGLLDAHLHAGNDRALDVLTGIGDWAWSRLEPLKQEQLDRMWNIYIAGEYGGINESMAFLHSLRPDRPEYLDAARRFVNNNVYLPTADNEDILDGRHANQHIPQFTGYLRIYEGGHDEGFHRAAENFWKMVALHRSYAHGGVGVGEMLRESDVIAGSLFSERNHAETCPLYNMLKLSRNLFFHDPDPAYMNYYERGLFNQMAGSRRDAESDESPQVTYFVPVRPGERRSYGNVGTCCGGSGMESHTKYQDSIYFRSVDDTVLYVNLYIASTLRWPEKGFTITQETRFPEEGLSTLLVEGGGSLEIRLRVPTWVRKGYSVKINGEAHPVEAVPGQYLSLSRNWSSGDRIDISMPFSFRTEGTVDDPSVQAIYFGPTLMAVQEEPRGEDLETGLIPLGLYRYAGLDGDLAPAMTPGEKPLHFVTQGLTLAPFYVADPASEPNPQDEEDEAMQRGRGGPPTQPYHLYFRRYEPQVVFGVAESGVVNRTDPEGMTFLDRVWEGAPFESHQALVSTVGTVADLWVTAGSLDEGEREAILRAAAEAEGRLASPL